MRKVPTIASRSLLIAAVSLCIAAAGFAQSTNSSDLRGTVTDSTGAVIPGATVTIVNTETGVTTNLTTNNAGIYDSVSIRPGKYRITISKEGFQKLVRDGCAWLDTASQRKHGRGFNSVGPAEQLAMVESIADNRPDRGPQNPGTLFFAYLKERVIDGFYTSRTGLDELGYRGNAFYASPPGCEHLYG